MKIGIVSPVRNPGWETQELARAIRDAGHEAVMIQPQNVVYTFPRGGEVRLEFNGQEIRNLGQLIVRSAKAVEPAVALLTQVLAYTEVPQLDPVERFSSIGKVTTTFRRWQHGFGTTSWLTFTKERAANLLTNMAHANYPLLFKPVDGRHGDGIVKFNTMADARTWLGNLPADEEKATPYLFQKCETFSHEYRALLVNGTLLAIVEKDKGARPFNREGEPRGTRFIPARALVEEDAEEIRRALRATCSEEGLLGVDVGITRNGQIHVIEENRAPEWENFQQALRQNHAGYDVAAAIITHMLGGQYAPPLLAVQPAPAPAAPAPEEVLAPIPAAQLPFTEDEIATMKRMLAAWNRLG